MEMFQTLTEVFMNKDVMAPVISSVAAVGAFAATLWSKSRTSMAVFSEDMRSGRRNAAGRYASNVKADVVESMFSGLLAGSIPVAASNLTM